MAGQQQHDQQEQRRGYSIQEVADALGCSRDLVNDAIRTRQLRSIKVGARRIIPADVFEDFLKTAS